MNDRPTADRSGIPANAAAVFGQRKAFLSRTFRENTRLLAARYGAWQQRLATVRDSNVVNVARDIDRRGARPTAFRRGIAKDVEEPLRHFRRSQTRDPARRRCFFNTVLSA